MAQSENRSLVERLADGVRARGISLAHGEPVSIGADEIVAVSIVGYGFGGGNGSDSDGNGGEGGGGGGTVIPIGAYVASPAGPVFRPNPIALIVVSIPAICAAGVALARIARALR